ncbi:MIOREX complex component 11 [Yarrowia sp. B02]|nr:MIOREX complex component 11 [Yarrowia sp. B02]
MLRPAFRTLPRQSGLLLSPLARPALSPVSLSHSRTFLFRKREPHPDDNDPILKHIPRFIRPLASRFKNAPVSYVTSFLIVHEITAIVPLFGLWWYFNHYDFVPPGLPDWLIVKGMSVIDKLLESQGWSFLNMENSARVVMQGAAAYALVKATLPVRIPISLVLTPPFARWIFIPTTRGVGRLFKNLFSRKKHVEPKIDVKTEPKIEPKNKSVFNQKGKSDPLDTPPKH